MIIEWKEERIKIIPLGKKPLKDKNKKVVNKKNIMLYPGTNEVEQFVWERAFEVCSSSLERSIDDGTLKLYCYKDKNGKTVYGKISDVKKMDTVRKIVENCNSVATLKQWLEEDDRNAAKSYIKNRLDKLEEYLESTEHNTGGSKEIGDDVFK